jgi:hypothetical protein
MKLGFLYFGTMNCNKTGDTRKDVLVKIRIVGRKGQQTGAEEPHLLDAHLACLAFSLSWLEGQREEALVSPMLFICSCLLLVKKRTPAASVAPDPCSKGLVRRLLSVLWPEELLCAHTGLAWRCSEQALGGELESFYEVG